MSNESKLLELVAEILEVEQVALSYELADGEWDSLAVVTFISSVDEIFDVVLSPEDVAGAKTPSVLLTLIDDGLAEL